MPHPAAQSTPATLAIVQPYQRPAITARGTAALRLSEFQDCWAELDQADRAWFAHWLNQLLIDAVLSGVSDGRR